MGNSRAEIGFDPEFLNQLNSQYSAYNLAIAGSRIATARRELNYFRAHDHKPKVIVLGLEFLDFLVDPSRPQIKRVEENTIPSADAFKWKFESLFSLTSVADAIKTIHIQKVSEAETITSRGFNPLLEYKKYAREQGYYALFQQRAIENAKSYVRKPHSLVDADSKSSQDWNDLDAILDSAAKDQTELHLTIYPYHAQILFMFEEAGMWPAFEQWKAMIAEKIAHVKAIYPNAQISLWDFSGYSSVQCEPIPAKGNILQPTQWYWEAGHFKKELGNMMLAHIVGQATSALPGHEIGRKLTVASVQQNQRRIESERSACLSSHPALLNDAKALIHDARSAMSGR